MDGNNNEEERDHDYTRRQEQPPADPQNPILPNMDNSTQEIHIRYDAGTHEVSFDGQNVEIQPRLTGTRSRRGTLPTLDTPPPAIVPGTSDDRFQAGNPLGPIGPPRSVHDEDQRQQNVVVDLVRLTDTRELSRFSHPSAQVQQHIDEFNADVANSLLRTLHVGLPSDDGDEDWGENLSRTQIRAFHDVMRSVSGLMSETLQTLQYSLHHDSQAVRENIFELTTLARTNLARLDTLDFGRWEPPRGERRRNNDQGRQDQTTGAHPMAPSLVQMAPAVLHMLRRQMSLLLLDLDLAACPPSLMLTILRRSGLSQHTIESLFSVQTWYQLSGQVARSRDGT